MNKEKNNENVNSEPLYFRLHFFVRFDQPIDRDKHYLSPGGFEMTMNGKVVNFDFEDNYGYIDEEDPTIVGFEMCHPDFACFPELLCVSKCDLRNVSEITEAFVYTGEEDTDPKVVELISVLFELPDDSEIEVEQSVIDKFNETLK